MGVFDPPGDASDSASSNGEPYVCLSCERRFEVQYHRCPVCGGYDIRRVKWVSA